MRDKPTSLVRYIAFVLASAVLARTSLLHAQEQALADQENWSAIEQEVWEQEERYWRLREARDFEGFMSLWDEDFVGWSGPGIISREDIRRLVRKEFKRERDRELRYELFPRAVRAYGNVVATFYTAVFRDSTGAEADRARFHHVWRNDEGTWKIIEGLSAAPLDSQE